MTDAKTYALNSEMLRLTWQLRQQSKRNFDTFNLTPTQGMMLIALHAGVSQSVDLATNLSLLRPTVSKNLSDLDAQGRIERHPDPGDRRHIRLQLTPEGRKTAKALLKAWHEGLRQKLMMTAKEHAAFEAWCKDLLS